MRVLVLCATPQSYRAEKAQGILQQLGFKAREFYYIGPGLERAADRCAGTINQCFAALGRRKFDIIVNEFCPVNLPNGSMLDEIEVVIDQFAKRRAWFITPLVPTTGRRSDRLIWAEFRAPSLKGNYISWPDLLKRLGFMLVDFSVLDVLAVFRR